MRQLFPTPKVETVGDDLGAQDSVAAWLALDLVQIHSFVGEQFRRLGIPCIRKLVRAAETRPIFVDHEEEEENNDASWTNNNSDMAAETITSADRVEERVVSPAQYVYECPQVLAVLSVDYARWAYETFKAVEFDSMYRLRDNADWGEYVQELRAGMMKR